MDLKRWRDWARRTSVGSTRQKQKVRVTCFQDAKNYQNNFTHNGTTKYTKWFNGKSVKKLNIQVPENSWKHEPRAIIENNDVMLTYDLMIPSSVNIENKSLQLDIVLRNKKENTALLIGMSVPNDFRLNKSGDGDGSRAVFDDVDCFRSQGWDDVIMFDQVIKMINMMWYEWQVISCKMSKTRFSSTTFKIWPLHNL